MAVGDKLKVLWKDGEGRLQSVLGSSPSLLLHAAQAVGVLPDTHVMPDTHVCPAVPTTASVPRFHSAGGEDVGFKVTKRASQRASSLHLLIHPSVLLL